VTKNDMKNKRPIDLSEAQRKLNIDQVGTAQSPHFQGLVERVVGAAKATLRPALRTSLVSSKELSTILAKTMGIIDNYPIAYTIRSSMDFHYRPLTPNHFLMGQPYAELQAEDTTKMTALKIYIKSRQFFLHFLGQTDCSTYATSETIQQLDCRNAGSQGRGHSITLRPKEERNVTANPNNGGQERNRRQSLTGYSL
jgi:hypothetical protein